MVYRKGLGCWLGIEIKCSDNHSFGSEKIKASSLKLDDIIQGKKVDGELVSFQIWDIDGNLIE